MNIAVITPSLATRGDLLREACESVARQILPPAFHCVGIDVDRQGSARMRNEISRVALSKGAEWFAFLDDDDILYPDHLQLLAKEAERGADLVYSRCDVEGRDWNPSRPFNADALRVGNFIPITVLLRAERFRDLGGFKEDVLYGWEDHDLWLRLLDAGGKFAYVDTATWLYRFHAGSKTLMGELAAV